MKTITLTLKEFLEFCLITKQDKNAPAYSVDKFQITCDASYLESIGY